MRRRRRGSRGMASIQPEDLPRFAGGRDGDHMMHRRSRKSRKWSATCRFTIRHPSGIVHYRHVWRDVASPIMEVKRLPQRNEAAAWPPYINIL
ncbi:UNVERIFIED_CONTAM: hypothetical protein K2H54_076681 [Gekko kuhli]